MDYFKIRKCKVSGFEWKQYNSLQKCPCNECVKERGVNKKPPVFKPKTAIKKVSDKRKKQKAEYQLKRILFLREPHNQKCPVTGKPTTDVHHMKGRIGNLLLDERYWIALSREGHKYIEENPEWAKENGYSLNRLDKDLNHS